MADAIGVKLVEEGAFFDRPLGKIAEAVYMRIPSYLNHMKKIKGMMDKENILNPQVPVKMF